MQRLPADLGQFLHDLRGRLAEARVDQHIGAARLQCENLRVDGRVDRLEARFLHDHGRRLGAELGLEALDVVAAEIVVLHENGDLGVRLLLHQILRIDLALGRIDLQDRRRPREVLGIVEFRGAGRQHELRHLLRLEVLLHRRLAGRAGRAEHEEHAVALDELARLLDGLGRRIGVIERDQVDLAAVDAALLVDHLKIGRVDAAHDAVDRDRARIGHGLADLDLGVIRALRAIFLLRERGRGERQCGGERQRGDGCLHVSLSL